MERFFFIFTLLFATFSYQGFSLGETKEILGNRMILQVNNFSYTQREIEIHFLIKTAIKPLFLDKEDFSLINEKNWEKQLDQFKNDMIVFIESQKLGKFQPTEEKINEAKIAARNAFEADPKLKKIKEHLDVSSELITKFIVILLQVDDFKISRRSLSDRVSFYRAERWFQELEGRYVTRFFYGTSEYQPI